jgi:hypothetical protein
MCRRRARFDQIIIVIKIMSMNGGDSCLAFSSGNMTGPVPSGSQTSSGKTLPADVVILAIGVRPDTTLAKIARLTSGKPSGISESG